MTPLQYFHRNISVKGSLAELIHRSLATELNPRDPGMYNEQRPGMQPLINKVVPGASLEKGSTAIEIRVSCGEISYAVCFFVAGDLEINTQLVYCASFTSGADSVLLS